MAGSRLRLSKGDSLQMILTILSNPQRVAITGGTSGLGLALVHRLHAQGARVAFVARHRDRVAEVAREHPGTHGIVGDVSIEGRHLPDGAADSRRRWAASTSSSTTRRISDPTPLALLGDTECEDLERALATNVLGPFRLTKALLGALAASARAGTWRSGAERVERRRRQCLSDLGRL